MADDDPRPDDKAVWARLVDRGIARRREVLGDDYVDRMLARLEHPFLGPLQRLVTGVAWGGVWRRSALGKRERSMITLAMLAAMGHETELALHLQGSRRNGCNLEEIREILLQVAVYAGVPASIAAFRVAESVFGDELETVRPDAAD